MFWEGRCIPQSCLRYHMCPHSESGRKSRDILVNTQVRARVGQESQWFQLTRSLRCLWCWKSVVRLPVSHTDAVHAEEWLSTEGVGSDLGHGFALLPSSKRELLNPLLNLTVTEEGTECSACWLSPLLRTSQTQPCLWHCGWTFSKCLINESMSHQTH